MRPGPVTRAVDDLLTLGAVPVGQHQPRSAGAGVSAVVTGADVANLMSMGTRHQGRTPEHLECQNPVLMPMAV
jgi:hypothetical protein